MVLYYINVFLLKIRIKPILACFRHKMLKQRTVVAIRRILSRSPNIPNRHVAWKIASR